MQRRLLLMPLILTMLLYVVITSSPWGSLPQSCMQSCFYPKEKSFIWGRLMSTFACMWFEIEVSHALFLLYNHHIQWVLSFRFFLQKWFSFWFVILQRKKKTIEVTARKHMHVYWRREKSIMWPQATATGSTYVMALHWHQHDQRFPKFFTTVLPCNIIEVV